MDQSKINVRYAKAFFSLAKEKVLTEELQKDAFLVSSVCKTISDFMVLIESPVISTSAKVKAIKNIFEGKVNPYSVKFLTLITENRREKFIPGIFRNLEELYRKDQGIRTAVLTTAKAMDKALVEQIRKTLESELGGKVEISQKIDDELIGGFLLRVDDTQYDASIAAQLQKIKVKLLQTELN